MSPSLPPPGGVPKKDSIFSNIMPAQAPSPVPAPRPAADPEALTALKQKIDALEKNIVSQLEKKIGDHLKSAATAAPAVPQAAAPVPPAPPPAADHKAESGMLYRKLEDLERRLASFGQTAAFSASQMKNIEESKISARREIEDLLKAVREQQKYSEMDRQIHAQLEKAWTRAEELERKLMEFYSSVLAMEAKRRDETAAASDRSAEAIDRLADRLAALEGKLSAAAAQPASALEQISSRLAEIDGKISCLTPEAAAEQQAVARDVISSLKEHAGSFKDIFDTYIRRELELLRDKFSVESEAQRNSLAAAFDEARLGIREQVTLAGGKVVEFESLMRKGDGIVAELEASSRRQASSLEEFASRLTREIRGSNAGFAEELKKEGEARLTKFGARYADALNSVAFVESFRSAVTAAADQLDAQQSGLARFLGAVSPAQLEKASGVSGEMVRRHVAGMAAAGEKLRADAARLRELERELESRVKNVFMEEK